MLKDIFAEFATRLEVVRRPPEAQHQRSPSHSGILIVPIFYNGRKLPRSSYGPRTPKKERDTSG